MSSLSAFLNPVQAENKEVIVSERFRENGKTVPFVIRPITQQENETLMKKHRSVDKKSGVEQFNRISYNRELTAMAVVEPDLNNAELQKRYGVLGADKVLSAMLYVGEYGTLMELYRNCLDSIRISTRIWMRQKTDRAGRLLSYVTHTSPCKDFISAWVLAGICGANDPVGPRERAFIYASIDLRVKEEKRQAAQLS